MNHFTFPAQFRALHDAAVRRYAEGCRGADSLFSPEEAGWLAANGIAVQHLYDYAEDYHGYGGLPGPDHALTIETIRRDYFLNVQGGKPSGRVLDAGILPAKTDAVEGITWLPRLLPKALAKLRGELPPSLMYGCGGDRRFFQESNILPAEFLSLVWRHESDPAAVVAWVRRRLAEV